jgi:hypothetical protein
MKSDGRLARCTLKGLHGDAIFAVLCGCGHNLRKIMRYLRSLFVSLLAAMPNTIQITAANTARNQPLYTPIMA